MSRSNMNISNGSFSIQIHPSIYYSLGTINNYQEPDGGASCSPSLNYDYWIAIAFTAENPTYLINFGDVESTLQLSLYSGINTGSSNQTSPPNSCLGYLQSANAALLTPGNNYTLVVSYQQTVQFSLYLFTGTQVGVVSSTSGYSCSDGCGEGELIMWFILNLHLLSDSPETFPIAWGFVITDIIIPSVIGFLLLVGIGIVVVVVVVRKRRTANMQQIA